MTVTYLLRCGLAGTKVSLGQVVWSLVAAVGVGGD